MIRNLLSRWRYADPETPLERATRELDESLERQKTARILASKRHRNAYWTRIRKDHESDPLWAVKAGRG